VLFCSTKNSLILRCPRSSRGPRRMDANEAPARGAVPQNGHRASSRMGRGSNPARLDANRTEGEHAMSASSAEHVDHVGSLLRPPELREAWFAEEAGKISAAALRAAQDKAIRE